MTFQVTATSVYTNSVSYNLVSGTLPTGLSLSNTGGISGTAVSTDSGIYSFVISAADAYSNVVENLSITTTPRTITWNNIGNLGTYVQVTSISIPLVSSSSVNAAISYNVTGGALPSGLTISSNTITGYLPSISTNTTYNFTVTATDGIVSNPLPMSLTSVVTSGTDAYAGNVVLLAHYDNGSFGDTIGHSVALFGSPTITSNGVGLYNSSVYLNGSSYIQYTPTLSGFEFELGANNFTIELSVYFLTTPANGTGLIGVYPNSSNLSYLIYSAGLSAFVFSYSNNGTSPSNIGFNYSFALNTWYTLAVVRSGTNCYGYVNGTYISSGTISGTIFQTAYPIVVGTNLNPGGSFMTGFVDEVRVTNGSARYGASNYTVSSFPNPPLYNYYLGNSISIIGGNTFTLNANTVYGAQPLTYSLTSGTIPAGLTVNSSVGVTGTTTNPASTTNYTFAITATDGYLSITNTFNASVLHGVTPTWVTTSGSLGTQVQGTNFSAQLNAVANALTLTTSAATTVAGNTLTFSSTTGVVLGMYILGPSMPSNTVVSAFSTTTVTTSQVIPPIATGVTYNFTPTPVAYTLTSGTLPSGLSLSASTGAISGTLASISQNTTTSFSVTASTTPTLNAVRSFSITVQTIAAVDPYTSYVTFEAPFNGSAGGTLFYDLAGHTVSSVVGSPSISTTTALIGGSSLYLNGSSAVVFSQSSNDELTFGTGNFTVEAAFNLTSLASTSQIVGVWGSTLSWALAVTSSSVQFLYSTNGSTSATLTFSGSSFSANTWYQIAAVSNSNTLTVYVNGTIYGTAQSLPSTFLTNQSLSIGYNAASSSNFCTGYIDAVRITNGIARYTSSYTPSLTPFQPVFFLTPAGSLGTQVQGSTFGVYVVAHSEFEYPVSYFIYSGALPSGLTLDSATGFIGGSLPTVSSNTTTSFIVGASDGTGTALQSFSITTATNVIVDLLANSVVAELHFDGLQGSTTFLDTKGHIIQTGTSTISVPIVSNIIRQMGSGSMFLDGVASFIYIGNAASTYSEFTFSTYDFTIEMSVYFQNTVPTVACFFEQNAGFGVTYYSNKIYFYATCPGGSNPSSATNYYNWTPSVNTWYQLAFVRSNGSFIIYVNGTALTLGGGSATAISTIASTYAGYPLEIGRYYPTTPVYWSGYVDELRVTIGAIGSGAARYTSNYTPQVQPFGNPYAPIFVNTQSALATQVVNSPFTAYTVAQEGGVGRSITYSISSGSLPSGITLNASTGIISGTLPVVTVNTTSTFTVAATDNFGSVAYLPATISIVPTNQVSFFANAVVFEAHYNGVPGSNTFTDVVGHVANVVGAPVISNLQYINSPSSLYLNGQSSISYNPFGTEFQLGTNDFTFELSFYLTSAIPVNSSAVPTSYVALLSIGNGGSNNAFLFYLANINQYGIGIYYTSNGSVSGQTNPYYLYNFSINTWYRVAVSRIGSNLYFYINGVAVPTISIGGSVVSQGMFGTSIFPSTGPLNIGSAPLNLGPATASVPVLNFPGYIADVRVTNGFCVYGFANSYTNQTTIFDSAVQPYFTSSGTLVAQTQNSVVDVFLPVSIANGRTISSYAISSGSLTSGLSLNSTTGHITGTNPSVTTTTSSSFIVAVTDNTSNVSYQSFTTAIAQNSLVDPYANTVIFMGHFDGPAGSTTFTESVTGVTGSITGGSPVLTNLYRQAGNASLFLNGKSATCSVDFSMGTINIGTGDFTIECSMLWLSGSSSTAFNFVGTGSPPTFGLGYSGNTIAFYYNNSLSTVKAANALWTPTLNTWYQIAVCRRSNGFNTGVISFFINGVELGTSQSFNQTISSTTNAVRILAPTGVQLCIDEVRISVGVGRYSGSYVPATMAFPDVTGPIIASNYSLSSYSGNPATFALPIYLANTNTSTISLVSGTLPTGFSFNGGNSAYIVGNAATTNTTTSSTFTVQAYDSRVPNVAAFGTFVVYDQFDQYAPNVVALLHFDGLANGVNTFVETLGHNVSSNVATSATPTASTTYQYSGSGSLYFNGNSAVQTLNIYPSPNGTDFSLGSGNFTIELSVNFTTLAVGTNFTPLISTNGWAVGVQYSLTAYHLVFATSPTTSLYPSTLVTLNPNVWYRFAVVRSSSTLYFYVNGSLLGSVAISATMNSTGPLSLQNNGQFSGIGTISGFTGYMDEIRVTIGVARYTGSTYSYVPNLSFADAIGARLIQPTATVNTAVTFANAIAYGYAGNSINVPLLVYNTAVMNYTLNSGSLPAGVTLGNTTAVISGTFPTVSNYTVYTFSVLGTDGVHFPAYGGAYNIITLGDSSSNSVILDMHFEGTNGSTNFVDTKGHSVTIATGSPVISTTTSYAGSSSLQLNGSSAIQVFPSVAGDFSLGNNFTIEASFNSSVSSTGTYALISQFGDAGNSFSLYVGNNQLNFLYSVTGGGVVSGQFYTYISTSFTFIPNVWYSVAFVRATQSNFFVNGQLLGISSSTPFTFGLFAVSGTVPITIGAQRSTGSYTSFVNGYIDEVRITKGISRYTNTYTVYNAPFPDSTAGVFTQQNSFTGIATNTISMSVPFVTTDNTVSYSIVGGSLPSGLTFSSNGVLSGTMPAVTTNTVSLISNVTVQISGANPLPVIQTFPIYAANDPYASNVVCQIHFEGANGTNSFVDGKGNLVTTFSGNPYLSNTYSYSGNSSLFTGPTGTGIVQIQPRQQNQFFLGQGDFTFEISFYSNAINLASSDLLSTYQSGVGPASQFQLQIVSLSSFQFIGYTNVGFTAVPFLFNMSGNPYISSFKQDAWYNIAVSKVGTTISGYVNGYFIQSQSMSTFVAAGGFFNSTYPIAILYQPGINSPFWVDELRITKVGRYIGNITYTPTPIGFGFPDSTNGVFKLASYYAANSGQTALSLPTPFLTNSSPITYTITSGTMPSGLTFNSNGVITGTMPVVSNTTLLSSITVNIQDSSPLPVSQTFPIYSLADVYQSNVVLMMHFEGANGSTVFTDTITGNSATISGGSPYVSTIAPTQYGASAIYLPSSAGSIQMSNSAVYALGSSNFTIEFAFFYPAYTSTAWNIIGQSAANPQIGWYVQATGNSGSVLTFVYTNTGATSNTTTLTFGSMIVAYNTWHTVAIVRSGTSLYAFIDGVQSGSTQTINGSIYQSTGALQIGGIAGTNYYTNSNGGGYGGAYLDEVRITIGVARYTSNYTPSITQFPH